MGFMRAMRGRMGLGNSQGRSVGGGYLGLPRNNTFSRLDNEGAGGLSHFNTNFLSPTAGNRTISTLGAGYGPMTTSRANYGAVLEAKREARLASMDAGLSTRGLRNAPGRGARPVMGGLEGRGVRPSAGSRSAGRPIKMRGLEHRGVIPEAGSRSAGRPVKIKGGTRSSESIEFGNRLRGMPAKGSQMAHNASSPVSVRSGGGEFGAYLRGMPEKGTTMHGRVPAHLRADAPVPVALRRNEAIVSHASMGKSAVDAAEAAAKEGNKFKFLEHMTGKKGLLIGAGVIGMGALLGHRRNRGTSSGAQGAYR